MTRPQDEPDASFFKKGEVASMFPEIIPATLLGFGGPVWLIHLLFHAQYAAAATLGGGYAAGMGLLAFGTSRRSAPLVHLAIFGLAVTAYFTGKRAGWA